MSTTAMPSSLSNPEEVCCHIWISISYLVSCTLQSKPQALHSASRDNQNQQDEFMTEIMQLCNMVCCNDYHIAQKETRMAQKIQKDTRGHYLFDMNCIRYHKKGRDEELVAQNSVQLAAVAADVE